MDIRLAFVSVLLHHLTLMGHVRHARSAIAFCVLSTTTINAMCAKMDTF